MTLEQMTAWLTLEGYAPYSDPPDEEWYPAARIPDADFGFVIFDLVHGHVSRVGGGAEAWLGATTWDQMKPEHVVWLYNAIQEHYGA